METQTVEMEQPSIRNRSPEERKRYFREHKQRSRMKQKKCLRHNAQATVKDLLTQELLCDTCDKERLVKKYRRKEEKPNESS